MGTFKYFIRFKTLTEEFLTWKVMIYTCYNIIHITTRVAIIANQKINLARYVYLTVQKYMSTCPPVDYD